MFATCVNTLLCINQVSYIITVYRSSISISIPKLCDDEKLIKRKMIEELGKNAKQLCDTRTLLCYN